MDDAALRERLEMGDDGKAIYWHGADCPNYCDYACNGNEGEIVARLTDALRAEARAEQRERDAAILDALAAKAENAEQRQWGIINGYRYGAAAIRAQEP